MEWSIEGGGFKPSEGSNTMDYSIYFFLLLYQTQLIWMNFYHLSLQHFPCCCVKLLIFFRSQINQIILKRSPNQLNKNRVVIMNQIGKQMMNQRQQKTKIISMLLIETLFFLLSSGEMIKHITKLQNILLALFLERMKKALEPLISMTENLQLKIQSI